MSEEASNQDKQSHLRKIINDARTAFFVTTTAAGPLHGRPMATAQVQENHTTLWFGTSKSSGIAAELKQEQHVLLGYTHGDSEWASVNGTARLVDDRAKIKELWNPFWKNYFEGPDDPNLVLIEVTPTTAEYWDAGSKAIVFAKIAIAAVTGKHMHVGDNEKMRM